MNTFSLVSTATCQSEVVTSGKNWILIVEMVSPGSRLINYDT